MSKCSAATLCVENVAQLFLCQAWSNRRSYFQQLNWQRKREEKAWLSVIRRY